MRQHRNTPAPFGHTLVELIAASACSTILLAGLAGVMFIAREISYAPTASGAGVAAAAAANGLIDELSFATCIVEHVDNAIEFVVADRDGDGVAERIRYEWSGTPGDPLERTINDGSPAAVVDSVDDFELAYLIDEETVRLTPYSESAETRLLNNENVTGTNERFIYQNDSDSTDVWVSQQINPGAFSSIPANAASWNATRVEFCGRRSGSASESLLIQLRSSGAPYYGPTSEALGTITVAESSIGSSNPPTNWNTGSAFSFPAPIRGLSLTDRYNLVWSSANSSAACRLSYNDSGSGTGVLESTDSGATWSDQFWSTRRLNYRLFGTYTTSGTPIDVTRSYLSRVTVRLQTAAASHSGIETGVTLLNRPELVSALWRADFESDPTNVDIAGDGGLDWILSSGSFDDDTLDGGIWTVDSSLESRPANDFANVTSIDFRCRNGARLQINADRDGGTNGPLVVSLATASGKQTLTLAGKTAENVEKTLATVSRLSGGSIRVRLLIVPQQNVVQLQVQDRVVGSYVYPTFARPATDRVITLSGTGAEFDYVEARVSSNTTVELVD